jgi:hypothetical protein
LSGFIFYGGSNIAGRDGFGEEVGCDVVAEEETNNNAE